jgi:uncharacterized membrane protein
MAIRAIERLKQVQAEHREKLRQIVRDAMKEEKILSENLIATDDETITFGQRMADKIASFGGSWKFIIIFLIVLVTWVAINVLVLTLRFDPYPFILMNLFLSCIAALQAPVIMMSQNRKEQRDRARAENDYMINLKAEMEIRSLHQKIDLLVGEGLKTLYESQANQLTLLKEIEVCVNHKSSDKKESPGS